ALQNARGDIRWRQSMTEPAQPGGASRLEKCRSLCFSLSMAFICTTGAFAQNRVLELDGTNSFVELPANAFTNLDEVTVEGWVKWESFGSMSRFFDFSLAGYSLSAMNR